MNFREWVKGIIEIDTLEVINDHSYIGLKTKQVAKQTFNLLKELDMLECTKLYKYFDGTIVNTILAFDKYINADEIFPIIRTFNCFDFINSISKDNFKDIIIGKNIIKSNLDTDNFYCRFLINPNEYTWDWVEKIEEILNQDVHYHTNINQMYEDFKKILENNLCRNIIKTHAFDFGIMVFDRAEDFYEYKNYIKRSMDIDDEYDVSELTDTVIPDILSKLNLNDKNIKVSAYDPNNGKIIDLAEYKKDIDKNKLN